MNTESIFEHRLETGYRKTDSRQAITQTRDKLFEHRLETGYRKTDSKQAI